MADTDFEDVYAEFYSKVRRQAERMLGDYHEAEDTAQETFLRILRRWSTLRRAAALPAWVRRIGRNAAVDCVRRRRHLLTLLAPAADVAPARASRRDEEEFLPALVSAIERLPDLLGITLLLAAVDQRTPREISALLRTTPANVKVRLHRARTLLARAWRVARARRV